MCVSERNSFSKEMQISEHIGEAAWEAKEETRKESIDRKGPRGQKAEGYDLPT
jgi:hypothetical protein